MTAELQTATALAIVAFTAIWLARRALVKKKTGCGGECSCPTAQLKR